MSPPRRVFISDLPGIKNLMPEINQTAQTAVFTDKEKKTRTIWYRFICDDGGQELRFEDCDGSTVHFFRCLSPNEAFWYADILTVRDSGLGIASNIFAAARDLLIPLDGTITPSGLLSCDSVNLWHKIDSRIEFEKHDVIEKHFQPKQKITGC